jgi:rhamnogalacturonyl hydrolase YesR
MKNFSFLHSSIILIISLCTVGTSNGQETKQVDARKIVETVLNKGLAEIDLGLYPGSLLMHGMSEFALLDGNEEILDQTITIFKKFESKEIQGRGNFISYEPGGSGAAYLVWKGKAPGLKEQVLEAAQRFYKHQKRTTEGLMTSKHAKDSLDQVFIDVAFATTPFLLYSGLIADNQEYIDFAVFETLELFRILRDVKTGLVHQARGFSGYGKLSEDNWSRGNGWGAFALAILVRDLPADHPKRSEVEALAKDFFMGVLKLQNSQGLWHQEMTSPQSYVETSGSGLLIYGLGIMLEKELLDKKYLKNFVQGLSGYLAYISQDGSVSHTCSGCLAPGIDKRGKKEDYIHHPWIYNDHHAFGPPVLAFTQALKLNLENIEGKMGKLTLNDSPLTPRTYVKNIEGRSITWENDRIAYRLFGPEVRNKVGSGIDIWVKSVDYPVIEKWYKLNDEGENYHTDRGEGYDFYDMGKNRGVGGLAIWHSDKPFTSETYNQFKIIKNQDDAIAFEVKYDPWTINGKMVSETKRIEMEKGTNLFKVTSTIHAEHELEIIVAVGLTTFGKAEIDQNKKAGFLSSWEQIDPEHGHLGTVIITNAKYLSGFAEYENDQFILMKVRQNQPFEYFVGAGWDKSKHFKSQEAWTDYVKMEANRIFR